MNNNNIFNSLFLTNRVQGKSSKKSPPFCRVFAFENTDTELGSPATLLCWKRTAPMELTAVAGGFTKGRLLELDEPDSALVEMFAKLSKHESTALLVRCDDSKQFLMARVYGRTVQND